MRTFAVINQKGGTGKTTTAVNVAAALAERKHKVLLLDLDPQASATSWLRLDNEERGLLDVFTNEGDLGSLVRPSETPGLDVIPASSWLIGLEKAVAGEVGAETILHKALEKLQGKWDYLFIDCPPSLGVLSISALVAAHEVLVPVEAHVMALTGLTQLVKTIQRVKERLNTQLEITAVLPCRVNPRTRLAQEVIESLRSHFGDRVLKTVIRENVKLAEAPSHGQPITSYDTRSNGAEDYRAAANELTTKKARGRSR